MLSKCLRRQSSKTKRHSLEFRQMLNPSKETFKPLKSEDKTTNNSIVLNSPSVSHVVSPVVSPVSNVFTIPPPLPSEGIKTLEFKTVSLSPVPVPIPVSVPTDYNSLSYNGDETMIPKLVHNKDNEETYIETSEDGQSRVAPDRFCGMVHDILEGVEREIECYDGLGSVSLIDVAPRLCPKGRGIDFAAARSARVSYGSDLRTPEQDRALVRYLILNRHTSPLEFISFTFRVKCPIFVARHIMRHRTTSINEVSARYTILPDSWFKLKDVRVNNKLNKQSSGSSLGEIKSMDEEIKAREIHEDACRNAMKSYKSLIDLGVARELARTVLPCGTFTEFYINMNLNNFLKFLTLRMADDTQTETREIANAMFELCRPLSPAIFDTHSSMGKGIFLTEVDVESIIKRSSSLTGDNCGRREKAEYIDKLSRLNISF